MSDDDERPAYGRRRRGTNAVLAFTARGLQQVGNLVTTLLAARFLAPAEYGVYTLALAFILLLQTATYTGVYQYVINSKEADDLVLPTSFWMMAGVAALGSLLLAGAAFPLARTLGAPAFEPVLLLLTLIQPFTAATAWNSAVLLRRGAMRLHFSIMFIQNLIVLVAGVVLLWMFRSIYALVALQYVRVLSSVALYSMLTPDSPSLRFDKRVAGEAIVFSSGLYGSRLLAYFAQYGADLILGFVFSTAEAGLYRFGNRIATGATDIIMQPLRSFAMTQFGAAGRARRDLTPLAVRFAGTATLLGGCVATVVGIFAADLVTLLFEPAYLAAVAVTYALALRAMAGIGPLVAEPALSAAHRTGLLLKLGAFSTLLALVAAATFSPFGLTAIAWGQAGAAFISTIVVFTALPSGAGVHGRPVLGAILLSVVLAGAYGLAMLGVRHLLALTGQELSTRLLAGLLLAVLLGLGTLAIGRRTGVFHASVFSG